jgi:hypothetical protein
MIICNIWSVWQKIGDERGVYAVSSMTENEYICKRKWEGGCLE